MINTDNIPDIGRPNRVNSGYVERDFSREPIGTFTYETPFDDAMDLMPIEEIVETMRLQEANKSSLYHIRERAGIVTQQNPLKYCHAFSPKGAALLLRARDGLDTVDLSGSSVGAPAAGFRNVGAPIYRDLQHATETGFATTDFVPDRTTSQRDFREGWKENAARHRFSEWLTMDGSRNWVRGLHQQLTCACRNMPVCNGLNYWGHAVTDLRFVLLKDPAGVRTIEDLYRIIAVDFLNSWGRSWGKDGIGRRTGRQMICDQAYAPTVPTPSAKL